MTLSGLKYLRLAALISTFLSQSLLIGRDEVSMPQNEMPLPLFSLWLSAFSGVESSKYTPPNESLVSGCCGLLGSHRNDLWQARIPTSPVCPGGTGLHRYRNVAGSCSKLSFRKCRQHDTVQLELWRLHKCTRLTTLCEQEDPGKWSRHYYQLATQQQAAWTGRLEQWEAS